MALQVWLPLNGNLNNQGLKDVNVTNNGAVVNSGGKIGNCYEFNIASSSSGTKYIRLENPITDLIESGQSFSFACFIKISGSFYSNGCGLISCSVYKSSGVALCLKATKTLCVQICDDGTELEWVPTMTALTNDTWHHICVTYNKSLNQLAAYINGILVDTKTTTQTWRAGNTKVAIGVGTQGGWGYTLPGYMNDVRIYNHCLSSKEVNEISKALLVHYKLDGDTSVENLFTGTAMTPDVRAGFVNNGSTDWTKPFRYYNGSTAIHTFSDTVPGEDTIKLSTTGNLGIAFVRSAADMNLDSSAYYTISCKAKCSTSGKKLCIGLSYYTTSNSWVWRGGNNAKAFSAVNTWQTFTLKFKPDANTQYICYCFTVAGTANGTATFTIKECKLEKGSSATAWTPSKLDSVAPLFYKNPGYDCSGYCRNGEIIDNAGVATGGRFNNSIKNSASTLLKSQVNIPALETITFSWWQKVETWGYQSSGLFATSNNSSYPSDYSTTACAHRDVGFDLCTEAGTHVRLGYSWLSSNGSTLVGSWHHMAITYNNAIATLFVDGTSVATTDLSGALKHFDYLYIGNSLNRYTIGAYSDFRIYGTALTPEQVLELYNTAAFVDNKQNIETFEFDEVTSGNPNITKSGIFKAQTFTEDVVAEIYEAEVKANQLIEI